VTTHSDDIELLDLDRQRSDHLRQHGRKTMVRSSAPMNTGSQTSARIARVLAVRATFRLRLGRGGRSCGVGISTGHSSEELDEASRCFRLGAWSRAAFADFRRSRDRRDTSHPLERDRRADSVSRRSPRRADAAVCRSWSVSRATTCTFVLRFSESPDAGLGKQHDAMKLGPLAPCRTAASADSTERCLRVPTLASTQDRSVLERDFDVAGNSVRR